MGATQTLWLNLIRKCYIRPMKNTNGIFLTLFAILFIFQIPLYSKEKLKESGQANNTINFFWCAKTDILVCEHLSSWCAETIILLSKHIILSWKHIILSPNRIIFSWKHIIQVPKQPKHRKYIVLTKSMFEKLVLGFFLTRATSPATKIVNLFFV